MIWGNMLNNLYQTNTVYKKREAFCRIMYMKRLEEEREKRNQGSDKDSVLL